MSPAAERSTLRLPARVDAQVAAQLYRRHLGDAPSLARIDLGAVESIDCAGLALVLELRDAAQRVSGVAPALDNVPAHFRALCAAHRIGAELRTPA